MTDEGRTGDGDRWIIEVDGQGIYQGEARMGYKYLQQETLKTLTRLY